MGFNSGEGTPMAFSGKMSCKHMFTPDNLLMYLSITVHADRFIFSLNLKPRPCEVQVSKIRLKPKRCTTLMGPTAFFSHLYFSLVRAAVSSALLSRSVDFLFRGGRLEVPQEPGPGAVPPRSQGSPPRGMEEPELNISWGEKKKGSEEA